MLAALAESFTKEAAVLRAAYSSADGIGALGRGWALLRAGRPGEAGESFGAVPSLDGAGGMISCVAKCGQTMASALSNKHRLAKNQLAAARAIAPGFATPDPGLLGWLDFTEALSLYRRGRYAAALEKIARSHRAFRSPFAPEIWDFPGFEAEVLLLEAKTLREMALYGQALDAARDDVELREQNNDLQGLVWALVEEARILRFMSNLKDARRQLRRAQRLLQTTDHWDLLSRVEDQLGDLARGEGDLARAERHYLEAERLGRQTDDPKLRGHVANSRARLLEDQNRGQEALDLLRRHQDTWRGSRALGKYLYLKGSLHFRVGDEAEAERCLVRAVATLRHCGMQSYEALAHWRLAEVLLTQGKKEEACREWAAALRIAPRVEAEAFLRKMQERVRELRAVDLLEVVSQLLEERARLQAQSQEVRAEAAQAEDRSFHERYAIGHWLIRPLGASLRASKPPPEGLPPVLKQFCLLLDNAVWFSQELARSPARPLEDIDVPSLIQGLLGGAGDLGQDFKVLLPDNPVIVRSQRLYLGQALLALFRGAKTAFGTRQMRLLLSTPDGVGSPGILRFVLESPAPAGFEHAARLVALDSAPDDPKLAGFFKKGYTGDFTLLDFLVGVALWGKLTFDTPTSSVNLTLPGRERKEKDHD